MDSSTSRRQLIVALGAAGVAGCVGGGNDTVTNQSPDGTRDGQTQSFSWDSAPSAGYNTDESVFHLPIVSDTFEWTEDGQANGVEVRGGGVPLYSLTEGVSADYTDPEQELNSNGRIVTAKELYNEIGQRGLADELVVRYPGGQIRVGEDSRIADIPPTEYHVHMPGDIDHERREAVDGILGWHFEAYRDGEPTYDSLIQLANHDSNTIHIPMKFHLEDDTPRNGFGDVTLLDSSLDGDFNRNRSFVNKDGDTWTNVWPGPESES